MNQFIDGYVIPIKKNKIKIYKKMAQLGCKLWMEHGALAYYECVGADLKNKWGIPFTKLCKLKSDETVVFAFILYKSKADRNRVNKKVHHDPRMNMENFVIPFDMKRFTMGMFKTLVTSKPGRGKL